MDNLPSQITTDINDSTDLEVIRSSDSLEIDECEEEVIFSPDPVHKEGISCEAPCSNDFSMMLHIAISAFNEGVIISTIEVTAYHSDALGATFEESSAY